MKVNLLKRILSVILTSTFLLSFSISPAAALDFDYYAGGGDDDESVTEILWSGIDDTDLNIDDAEFDPTGGTGKNDAFDDFGFVWVRTGGNWYEITVSEGGVAGGSKDVNSSSFEATITRTVNSILVTATLTIINNRAKWTVTTDAPVQQVAVGGNLGSDGSEYWYNPSTYVWWSNEDGDDSGGDPLLRFETSTGGTLRQNQIMPPDESAGSGFEGTQSDELGTPGYTDDDVIAISSANVSEFSLSVCLFDYTSGTFGGTGDTADRNTYIDNLNADNCGLSSTSSTIAFPWVGAQSISCPDANPWVEQELSFANKVTPLGMSSTNLVGRNISQSNLQNLFTEGVYFDAASKTVSTATEVLPIYGCNDKLLKAKIGKPIQFIVGGFTLQSEARGYIQGASSNWYDLNGVTLHPDTAAFMHTVKFTKPGRYTVVITEQPDTRRGLIPTYGVRSVRFVININE